LNSIFFKLADVIKEKEEEGEFQGGESPEFPLRECIKDVIWSNFLMCVVWSFGAGLNKELRKVFEETFSPFRRKFNINIGSVISQGAHSQGLNRNKSTLFDIFYDPERLQWDLLQEKLEYKLKLHYDPLQNHLLIPTVEVSQSYFLADILFSAIKHESLESGTSLNKHLRIIGPSATSKTTALQTFAKKHRESYETLNIPMSAYLTFGKLKEAIEKHYFPKKRNLLEPKDPHKKIILIIDDLHLHSNLQINVLEFFRSWCSCKGYYDMQEGLFKHLGDFGLMMGENCDYRRSYCGVGGKTPLESQSNRFLFYSNTLYQDEYDSERIKIFIQHWLTSKMWNTSKLVNKYYILITNCLMFLNERLKRQEIFHQSSFLKLNSFHLFARFCSNLANYTLISDEVDELVDKSSFTREFREEDYSANMMAYELQRTMGDRILMPQHRVTFLAKVAEVCKMEFLCGNHMAPAFLDQVLLGNYHVRKERAHVKYINQMNALNDVKKAIKRKLAEVSNNHFLETFLEAPNSLKEIFRLSRILFKDQQHLMVVGMPSCGKHEYLQLAAILNDALMFEINAAKYNEPIQFAQAFKDAVLSTLILNQQAFVVVSEHQLRDSTYIDFIYNFVQNLCAREECVLMDEVFKK